MSINDTYYGYSAHGTGPIYAYCDDEWTSSTSVRTYSGKGSSPNGAISEYSRLKLISEEIIKKYDLQVTGLVYYNMIDVLNDPRITEFSRSLGIRVIAEFHKTLQIGDYAPSYWIDTEKKVVYIGTKLKSGDYRLCKSSWNIDKNDKFSWTELGIIK